MQVLPVSCSTLCNGPGQFNEAVCTCNNNNVNADGTRLSLMFNRLTIV
jgi:hypothetical protein